MKKTLLAVMAWGLALTAFSQTDTTGNHKNNGTDTIKIGGMIIIRKPGDRKSGDHTDSTRNKTVIISNRKKHKLTNVSTNWWVVDVGFANYNDQTAYSSTATQQFAPGSTKDRLTLRTSKSVNVNVWLFMQRLNLVKHYLNFKYGLGLETNNYRIDDNNITFQKNPTQILYAAASTNQSPVKKNKLAADYITVPAMINVNFMPGQKKSFGFSAGVSAGYLYSARQKIKRQSDEKQKLHGEFDLNKWKLSYIGELSLGPVRLYGSYAFKSMWSKGLDQTPYTVGIRFSNW